MKARAAIYTAWFFLMMFLLTLPPIVAAANHAQVVERTTKRFIAKAKLGRTYKAFVVNTVDGDTLNVTIPSWKATPFYEMPLRIYGIDTPESSKQFAKCGKEVELGKAAKEYVKGLAKKGDAITFTYVNNDKYFRIDADVTLVDGRNWKTTMINKGLAVPYLGGTKKDWCK